MTRLLLFAGVLLLLLGSLYLVLAMIRSTKQAAWPGDSPQYRNHQGMARWIERQLGDDMVQVTISDREKVEARRLLGDFYGDRAIERGD